MINLRTIDDTNFFDCMNLNPGKEQQQYVAPNMMSLAQAYLSIQNDECTPMPFAIYHEDMLVGFIQLAFVTPEQDDALEEAIYEVWRFMIDEKFQGKGYGQEALMKAIDYILTFPKGRANQLFLSYVPGNIAGEHIYRKAGFVPTGEVDDGEIVMVYDLATAIK